MLRIAVLASGSGSNLQVIIDRLHLRVAGIEVAVVVSNVLGALALERAERADIPTAVFPLEDFLGAQVNAGAAREARDQAMAEAIEAAGVDLVVLAGYMHMLTPGFLHRFPYRVINLHPALLPAFPGVHGIEDALRYGAKVTGVTVHFVDAGMDSGPLIAQEALPVHDDDTLGSLATRIHALEHLVLPRVIELFALGKISPPEPGSRRVRVDDDVVSEIVW
ncbi:MAG: phosphoribosylglycinamide formyltransferase [Thermoleophilia bacterium]